MSEFSRRLAVVIGINQYENGIPTLRNAVNDAEQINRILKEQHGYETLLLLDRDATKDKLTKLLTETLPNEVKQDECLLFYFAGHGIAEPEHDGPQGYLIPQDAIAHNSSYLPMKQVHDWLIDLGCRHFLAILDCCFAGAIRWSSMRDFATVPEEIYQEHYDRFIKYPAWQVITSASYDETALDIYSLKDDRGKKGNHSPFAAALMDALEGEADSSPPAKDGKPAGDGVITANELYLYLRDRIEPATIRLEKRQTPGLWYLKKHDRGEYIFLTPGHKLNLRNAPPLDESTNPYQGLESFEEDDKDWFFGRTALVKKLYEFVNDKALTVVLGASGAGKSSLVKAGLIPELRKNQPAWTILDPIRPDKSPFRELNNALKKASLPEIEVPDTTLAQSIKNLDESIKVWAINNQNSKLLLFIDQSEELITLCKNDIERQEFLSQLAHAITNSPDRLRVVITVRSDFEPQLRDFIVKLLPNRLLLDNTVINNEWQKARFIVPVMTRAELREAIEKPAEARVMDFDPHSLVDDLIDEVADMPGALPLLSFALSQLYLEYLKRQKEASDRGIIIDRVITQEDYEKIGGVTQSLTKRADQKYQNLVDDDPAYDKIVRNVMLRMVALGGGELSRRRVPDSELKYPEAVQSQVEEVIQRFSEAEARLLIFGKDGEDNPYVEPAHDALIRGWPKIRNWLEERQEKAEKISQFKKIKNSLKERLDKVRSLLRLKNNDSTIKREKSEEPLKINLPLQRELTTAGNNWSTKKESDKDRQAVGFLWDRDPRLPQLEQIQQSDDNWFNRTESLFVEGSIVQKRRNIRNFWIGIGVSFAFVTGFALYFWWELQQSQLREKAARSENLLATDPLESLVIAIDAIGQNRNTPIVNWNIQPEVQNSLLNAVQTARERNRFTQSTAVSTIALSRDGKRIASTDSKGNVYLWDLQGNQLGQPLKGNGTSIGSLEFSPDGKILIAGSLSASSDTLNSVPNPVQFWDLQGNQIQPFGAYSATITTATFSPDGRLIVGGGPDGTIYWRSLQGNPTVQYRKVNSFLQELNSSSVSASSLERSNSSAIRAVAFSPNGIASVDQDGCVYLWQLQSNQLNKVACNARVNGRTFTSFDIQSIALNKNGDRILINLVPDFSESGLGIESFALLWSLKEGKWKRSSLKVANPGFSSKVLFAAFSPDGNTIVTGDQDGSVRLWDAYGKDKKSGQPLLGHSSNVESVAFSSDGKRVISSSTDGTIRLWDVEQNLSKQPKSFSRYGTSMVLSPDGQTLAIGGKSGKQGTVTLLNITGNQIGQILVGTKIQEESNGDYENGHPLAVSSNGYVVVVDNSDNNKSHLTLWHPGITTESQPIGSPEIKFGDIAAISPDSQRIASTVEEGGATDAIRIWDIQGNPIGQPLKNDDNFSVQSIAFSPDSQQIVSGSTNYALNGASNQSSVCLLHLKVDGLKKKSCKSVPGELNRVAFSLDSKTVAIGQNDGGLYLWNLQTKTIGERFGGNEQPVLSVAFSPDSKMLASGSRDGSMRLWNLNGNPIGRAFQSYTNQHSAVSSIAFNQDGKTVIVAYNDGSVRFWQANLERLLQVACDRLRDHSIWKNPGNEEVRGAKKTCEENVWNLAKQTGQNGEIIRNLSNNIPPSIPSPQTTIANLSAPSIVQPSAPKAPSPTPASNNGQDTPSSSAPSKVPARPQNVPSPTPSSNNGQNNYR